MVTTRQTSRVTSASHRRPATDPDSPVKKFYKVVLPSTLQKKMMKIPTRFVQLVGSKLSDDVTLETPVGFKRTIKLKRIGEEIWLEKGWSEFAEAHSIIEGHFLYFEYIGNSSFRVVIFDVSACEIEYPLDSVDISDSDDDIVDITDQGFLGTQGKRGNDVGGSSEHKAKKRPRDDEFEKILNDVDALNLTEEEKDVRVFKGKQFF